MAGLFDDNPPSGMVRSKKGWLKPKPSGTRKHIVALKQENTELKSRLEQLEAVVEQLTVGKKIKK